MQGEAIALQQPGARQEIGAGGDAAHAHALPRQGRQPPQQRAVAEAGNRGAGADDEPIERGRLRPAEIRGERDAIRGFDGRPQRREMVPAVERPVGDDIGGAQRLDGRGIGQQREARDQQEADPGRTVG
jgi:hypothetical protein